MNGDLGIQVLQTSTYAAQERVVISMEHKHCLRPRGRVLPVREVCLVSAIRSERRRP